MFYFATASGQKVRAAIARGELGQIRTPDEQARLIPGARWVADNGCFSADRFTFDRWERWLTAQPRTADWATVPDVVGDHPATLTRWVQWAPRVRQLGFRPAFVAQDGCLPDDIPDDADAVFIGGTTDWKLSNAAHACIIEAQNRGLPTHMGRVNSLRRLRIAAQWGIDTVDGTFLAFGPDQNLPRLLNWLNPAQTSLFGGVG